MESPSTQPGHEAEGAEHRHDHDRPHASQETPPESDSRTPAVGQVHGHVLDDAPARHQLDRGHQPHEGHGPHEGHEPDDGHEHGHSHRGDGHGSSIGHFLRSIVAPHSHDATDALDRALEDSGDGIRAVAVCLAILVATATIQAVVAALSGSVALLGDTLHNAADGFTAVPLWLAFKLGRRRATQRFTFGYGKAEDVAGVVVIVLIAASAAVAGFEAIERLLHPRPVTDLGYVMGAAVVGAIGNWVVAAYRIRVGRRIGSAALEADGLHARADGVTSLLVLVGAFAVHLGLRWADPAVGILITATIIVIGAQAVRSVGQRLLDAVDPTLVGKIESTVAGVAGVRGVTEVRARWVGHRLFAEVRLSVAPASSLIEAHGIAEAAQHALLHQLTKLSEAIIHVDPDTADPMVHEITEHHRERR